MFICCCGNLNFMIGVNVWWVYLAPQKFLIQLYWHLAVKWYCIVDQFLQRSNERMQSVSEQLGRVGGRESEHLLWEAVRLCPSLLWSLWWWLIIKARLCTTSRFLCRQILCQVCESTSESDKTFNRGPWVYNMRKDHKSTLKILAFHQKRPPQTESESYD